MTADKQTAEALEALNFANSCVNTPRDFTQLDRMNLMQKQGIDINEEADKPFELTKSDLDRIENYLKGTFEC